MADLRHGGKLIRILKSCHYLSYLSTACKHRLSVKGDGRAIGIDPHVLWCKPVGDRSRPIVGGPQKLLKIVALNWLCKSRTRECIRSALLAFQHVALTVEIATNEPV